MGTAAPPPPSRASVSPPVGPRRSRGKLRGCELASVPGNRQGPEKCQLPVRVGDGRLGGGRLLRKCLFLIDRD